MGGNSTISNFSEGIFQLHWPARLALWQANAQRRRPASFRHESWTLGFCRIIKPSSPTMAFECLENLKITDHHYSMYILSCLPKALAKSWGSLASWAAWGMLQLESTVDKPTRRIMHHNIATENRDMLLAFAVLWKAKPFESVSVSKYPSLFYDLRGSHQKQKLFWDFGSGLCIQPSCQAEQVSAIANCGKWWEIQEKLWAGLHCSTQLWRVVAKCRSPQASMANATPEESAGDQGFLVLCSCLCRHEFTKGEVGTLTTHRMRH